MENDEQNSQINYVPKITQLETKRTLKEEKKITNSSLSLKRLKSLNNKNNDEIIRKSINTLLYKNLSSIKNLNRKEAINREEKFNINQVGIIELAQQHSLANRPLKHLKEPNSDTKYCKCCGLPCITPGVYETFKVCDDTDKYSILGEAISLYFSFYKFCIFILFVTLCVLFVPSFYMINNYHSSLNKMCHNVKDKSFIVCDNFMENNDNNNKSNDDVNSFQSQFNAANLISYVEFYNTLMENKMNDTDKIKDKHGKLMDKIVINNSISYFIVLITLLIINIIYIIFQNNTILYYNFRVISPSDYTIMISNMSNICESFLQMRKDFLKNKNILLKEYHKTLGFSDSELANKNITEAMEFSAYIKKFVINKNETYNIESINICYKLDKYTKYKEEADKYNEYLFELENSHTQIKKNRQLKLKGNRRIYFHSPFPQFLLKTFRYCGCDYDCCGKKIRIMNILQKRKNKENELNRLLDKTNFINEKNFANVVFISFSTISEQEQFLKKYSKNFFEKVVCFFQNIFAIIFKCCKNKEDELKKINDINKIVEVTPAPEPDDILFENLDTTNTSRFFLVLLNTLISFLIIALSFTIIILLTMAQEKINNLSFGEKNYSKYAVSLAMTIIISIVNILFELILEILTKKEHHISLTNFNLSFSVKLSICTFVNSAIVPLISNIIVSSNKYEIDSDLLVSNMLTMFAVNSIVSPLMWTFNVGFYLNKLIIWKLETKKTNQEWTQKKLNELYEYMDIKLAYKYSYLSKTLLMTFFYLPIFPLGIVLSMAGFIFGFYLEKFNLGHRYKRPEMMNHIICKFYTNFFVVNFFMLSLGDFIFLKDKYRTNYWAYINLTIFLLLLIIPFGPYLKFNLLGINQSNINKQTYSQVYFIFYSDYELINPFTIKKGRINYIERLKNLNYLSEHEFQAKKERIEKLSFFQIISEAKPKRIVGMRRGLLDNINIKESVSKPKRLFELIKKLYDNYLIQEENEKNKLEEISTIIKAEEEEENIKRKIPNILHLVGTIFGTDEENDDKDDNNLELSKKKEEKQEKEEKKENQSDSLRYFKDKRAQTFQKQFKFLRNHLNKNKSPFIIKASIQSKKNNEDNIINKDSQFNMQNNEINCKTLEEKNEMNTIIGALKKEIKTGKKNLKKFSDWCEEKEELKNQKLTKSDAIDHSLKRINSTNVNTNNFSQANSKGNISYISNISVTINQYFDRPKNNIKIQNNNLLKSNNTIIESEQEDNKTNRNKYNLKKEISLINKNKENTSISNIPINNFINIVVNNDDNNTNNIKDDKNEDKIFINEYINIK